jgi:hypothetical protein
VEPRVSRATHVGHNEPILKVTGQAFVTLCEVDRYAQMIPLLALEGQIRLIQGSRFEGVCVSSLCSL